jgi:hypothetical protein
MTKVVMAVRVQKPEDPTEEITAGGNYKGPTKTGTEGKKY